jgi:hypothetical protein
MVADPWALGGLFPAHKIGFPLWQALVSFAQMLVVADHRINLSAWQQLQGMTLRDTCVACYAQYALLLNVPKQKPSAAQR